MQTIWKVLTIFCLLTLNIVNAAPKPLGGTGVSKSVPTKPLSKPLASSSATTASTSTSQATSTAIPKVIEITKGQVAPTPIAITEFTGDEKLGKKLADVIGNDLIMCGRFRLIGKEAFIQNGASLAKGVRYEDWRVLNAQMLLTANVSSDGGKITIEFRLHDVFKGTQILGLSLSADEVKWRKLAHMVADAIFERVTGDAGFFDSQLVFVSETGSGKNRTRTLSIIDFDGENFTKLTDGKGIVLTPRFSPSTQEIAFLKFGKDTASVWLMNVASKNQRLLGEFKGMNFAPRFSPDGGTVVMSLTKGPSTGIYSYNIASKALKLLTNHSQIDTSPCYSPDGTHVVFTSDRNNNVEKIFVMGSDGSGPHQISQREGKYSQPVWSPRGDLIAFTKQKGGRFYLAVMNIDGSNERSIDEGYLIEGVTWSPNGRYLIYTKETQGRVSKLFCIDLTGMHRIQIKTPFNASDPAWSPLLSSLTVKK